MSLLLLFEVAEPDAVADLPYPMSCPDLEGARVPIGTAGSFAFTIMGSDGRTFVPDFDAGDDLSASAWPGDDYSQSFAPTVVWTDVDAAEARMYLPGSATAGLPPGDYRIQVYVDHGGETFVVHDGTFRLGTSPGAATAPAVYCSFDDMAALFSGLESLQGIEHDETGFLRQRAMAKRAIDRHWIDRYDPRPESNRRRSATADPSYGLDIPDTATAAPTKAQLRAWLNSTPSRVVADEPEASILREIAARLAVAYVLDRNPRGQFEDRRGTFADVATAFRERATAELDCYRPYIDSDSDGDADYLIGRNVTFLT